MDERIEKLFLASKGLDYDLLDPELVEMIAREGGRLEIARGHRAMYHRYTNIMELPRRSPKEIVFHEAGHFIDDCFCSDPNEYASHRGLTSVDYEADRINRAFRKTFSFLERRSVKTMCLQDLVYILTRGRHRYRFYRPSEELDDGRKVRAEIFANLFCIKLLGNRKHMEFVEENFPRLWEEFNSILGGNLNEKRQG